MIQDRFDNYDKKHCWQYDIRINNLQGDLDEANMTIEEMQTIRVSDFRLGVAEARKEQLLVRKFIEKHEMVVEF